MNRNISTNVRLTVDYSTILPENCRFTGVRSVNTGLNHSLFMQRRLQIRYPVEYCYF